MYQNTKEFRFVDCSVHQLIVIAHIYTSVDANLFLEFSNTYLDLFKACFSVWHESLLHKLKNNVIDNILY